MDLGEVQHIQEDYDNGFWAHKPGFDTIRHSTLHLGKLLGKISTYCEAAEHDETLDSTQLKSEVIPDLLIFAARLANDAGLDLGEAFTARTDQLRERYTSQ